MNSARQILAQGKTMNKIVSSLRVTNPKMSQKTARDHMRLCATGSLPLIGVTSSELIKFMCEIDAYEYYYDFFLRHFESIASIIGSLKNKGDKVDSEAINLILSEVGLYQNLPMAPYVTDEPKVSVTT
jgi:hypothetical protein